jgi:hypothetical protein
LFDLIVSFDPELDDWLKADIPGLPRHVRFPSSRWGNRPAACG